MNKIKDKIEKLLKHAQSAREIGSIGEAEAFAEVAQDLMMRYAIDVEVGDETALMRLDGYLVATDTWLEDEGIKKARNLNGSSQANKLGYKMGQRAGSSASTAPSSRKRIGGRS